MHLVPGNDPLIFDSHLASHAVVISGSEISEAVVPPCASRAELAQLAELAELASGLKRLAANNTTGSASLTPASWSAQGQT